MMKLCYADNLLLIRCRRRRIHRTGGVGASAGASASAAAKPPIPPPTMIIFDRFMLFKTISFLNCHPYFTKLR